VDCVGVYTFIRIVTKHYCDFEVVRVIVNISEF